MKRKKISQDNWKEGIPNRDWIFPTRCKVCGKITNYRFHIDDETWNRVVPKAYRRDLLCLQCTDKLCCEQGIDIAEHLEEICYCGIDKTIVLTPEKEYYWDKRERTIGT